jgi:sigma-B regulation protein RsbU (phosphoserine phosphatase)
MWRLGTLIVLIGAALVLRGLDVYQIAFRRQSLLVTIGFNPHFDDRGVSVGSIEAKDFSGKPNQAYIAGLRKGDRIVAMATERTGLRTLAGLFEVGEVLGSLKPREPLEVVVERETTKAGLQTLRMTLPRTAGSRLGWWALILVVIVLPLLAITTAALVGFLKPEDDHAFLASLMFLGLSSLFVLNYFSFPAGLREFALLYDVILQSFAVYLVLRFFLLFPSRSPVDQRFPWLKTALLIATIPLAAGQLALTVALCHSFQHYGRLSRFLPAYDWIAAALTLVPLGISLLSLVLNTLDAKSQDERRRMVLLLASSVVSLSPLILVSVWVAFSGMETPSIWLILAVFGCLGIFPLAFIYVVVRHRVFGIRFILRRSIEYALVSKGFLVLEGVVIFLLFFYGAGPLFVELFPMAGSETVAASTTLVTLVAVAGLGSLNRRIKPIIDRRYFRESYDPQAMLTEIRLATRKLAARPDDLLATVTDKLSLALHPDQVAVFLRESRMENGNRLPTETLEKENPEDVVYTSRCIRMRTPDSDTSLCAFRGEAGKSLPAGSFIARHLERFKVEDPVALDVYPEDPKSWAHALVRSEPGDDEMYAEKSLLEELNTRLLVPLVTNHRVLGFLSLGEKLSEEPYSRRDRELLLTVAEQTAIALDYSVLITQVSEQERFKRELEIAREVQAQLFPQSLPPFPSLEYTGVCRAARGVGGDYYDFLPLDSDRLGIALGDISGKGISAALLMASLQALLRSHAPLRNRDLSLLISDINRLLCSSTDASKYATFFYGLYDAQQQTLTYVNAGHNPPMLFRSNELEQEYRTASHASDTRLRQAELATQLAPFPLRLKTGGTVLGFFENARYQQEEIQLRAGDVLLAFSDGVSEALNSDGEEFGEARLMALIGSNLHRSALELQQLLISEISRFVGNAPPYDDLTLVVAKVS